MNTMLSLVSLILIAVIVMVDCFCQYRNIKEVNRKGYRNSLEWFVDGMGFIVLIGIFRRFGGIHRWCLAYVGMSCEMGDPGRKRRNQDTCLF